MAKNHYEGGTRLAALLLALILLLGMPVTALAEEDSGGDDLDFSQLREEEASEEVMAEDSGGLDESGDDGLDLDDLAWDDGDENDAEEPHETPKTTGNPRADLINSVSLSPRSPGSDALDALLDDILEDIIDENMDTYEQVKACYDYLVATMSYGSHMSRLGTEVWDGVTARTIYSRFGEVEGFGAVALSSKVGLCNAYNSAFILMTNKLGIDTYLVKGSTRGAGGSYVYHEWTELKIGDRLYVFDPQLEQNLRAAGLGNYVVFFRTYDEVAGRYVKR